MPAILTALLNWKWFYPALGLLALLAVIVTQHFDIKSLDADNALLKADKLTLQGSVDTLTASINAQNTQILQLGAATAAKEHLGATLVAQAGKTAGKHTQIASKISAIIANGTDCDNVKNVVDQYFTLIKP